MHATDTEATTRPDGPRSKGGVPDGDRAFGQAVDGVRATGASTDIRDLVELIVQHGTEEGELLAAYATTLQFLEHRGNQR